MPLKLSVGVAVLAITMFVYIISLAVWIATLKTGEHSVSLVADQHRAEVARSTRDRIDDQLSAAESLTRTNSLMFHNGAYQHPDRPDPRGAETQHFLSAFRSQLYGSRFITTVSMTDYRGNLFGVYTNYDFTFFGMWEQFANASNNNSPTLLDYETYPENHPKEGQPLRLIGTTPDYNCSTEIWYTVTDVNVNNSNAWTPMYHMGNVGEVTTMLSQSHVIRRADGSLIGVTSIDMATGFVGATLTQVGHKDMLTFCVDAFENALLGTSKSDPITRCKTGLPLSECPVSDQAFLKPAESENNEVSTVTNVLLSRFDNDWKNVRATQFQSGDYLIDVELVVKNKLRWVVVVVVPQSAILAETRANTSLMIALQSTCGVVQIILSVIFAWLIRRPLSRLIEQMESLKRFETEEQEDSTSIFSEVSLLQKGHVSLRSSMGRVKSFVPQSVLAELTGENLEDDEEDEMTHVTSVGSSAPSRRSNRSSIDNHSVASTRSGASTVIAGVGAINKTISTRRVSVLACNVRGFHGTVYGSNTDTIRRTMDELVNTTVNIAKKHRGMLDYFQGDHFVFSFNAVSHNAAHCKNAILSAMNMVDTVGSGKMKFLMNCGVGTSVCSIGNMGSNEVRRFGIIGPAFSQAVALEKMCRRYKDINVLTVREACQDCEGAVLMQAVDVVQFALRTQIFAPRIAQEHGTAQEWMYDMQDSPFKDHNKNFEAFLTTPVTPCAPPPDLDGQMSPEELLKTLMEGNVDGTTYARSLPL